MTRESNFLGIRISKGILHMTENKENIIDVLKRIESILPYLATKKEIKELTNQISDVKEEQKKIKEIVGSVKIRDITRLEARIDQISLSVPSPEQEESLKKLLSRMNNSENSWVRFDGEE